MLPPKLCFIPLMICTDIQSTVSSLFKTDFNIFLSPFHASHRNPCRVVQHHMAWGQDVRGSKAKRLDSDNHSAYTECVPSPSRCLSLEAIGQGDNQVGWNGNKGGGDMVLYQHFTYTKRYYLYGSQVSCTLMTIFRIASLSNKSFNFLNGNLGTIFS